MTNATPCKYKSHFLPDNGQTHREYCCPDKKDEALIK